MDLSWLAITLSETGWLMVTFFMGFLAYKIGLPPMVGFLCVGFILKTQGLESTAALREIADLGVTLMLFTIGLKLDLKNLLRFQIWGVASLHMLITVLVFTAVFIFLKQAGIGSFANMDIWTAVLIAFALSFSSTVFAVKVLEGKNEMMALYAQIAIGILIVQDIFAVVFLTASTGKLPTIWALLLFGLPLLRPLLYKIMDQVEHGELLVLFSLLLATGGAALFEIVGMKADLGALVFGLLLAPHAKAAEVSKTLYNFKDLFLVGFFVNIGLSGDPTVGNVIIAGILSLFMFTKVFLFFWLLVKTRMRSRTSFLVSLSLANYSEFGLIVAAIGVKNGWLDSGWLISIAIALAMTFIIASPINAGAHSLYTRFSAYLCRWQSAQRLADEKPVAVDGASIIIFGMGRIGTGVYNDLNYHFPGQVIGVDFDAGVYHQHEGENKNIIYADVMDKDFWSKLNLSGVCMVFLNLPEREKNLFTMEQLREHGFKGYIAAIALYDEDIKILKAAGANEVYNFYSEAGIGFAEHVRHNLLNKGDIIPAPANQLSGNDVGDK